MAGVLCGNHTPELCFFSVNLEWLCLQLDGWAGQSCHCLVAYEVSSDRKPSRKPGLAYSHQPWAHRSPGSTRPGTAAVCPLRAGVGRMSVLMCMIFFYFKIKGNMNDEFSFFLFLKLQSTWEMFFFKKSFQVLNVETQLKPDSTAFYRNTQPPVTLGS